MDRQATCPRAESGVNSSFSKVPALDDRLSWSCCNKTPQNRHYPLTVLEAGKFKLKVQADSGLGEGSPDSQTVTFSLCPHMAEREPSLFFSLLINSLISP